MRRSLVILLALVPLAILSACSSTDDAATTTTAPPTTQKSTTTKAPVSTVVIAPENTEVCAEVTAYDAARRQVPEVSTADEAGATELLTFLNGLQPLVDAIADGAPPELQPWLTSVAAQRQEAAALDMSVEADRQKLATSLVYPSDEVKAANETFADWAATNCGIDVT